MLAVVLIWGSAAGWPVFSDIVNFGDNFKNYWEETSPILQLEPDKMPLGELADHFGVTPQAINNYLTHELDFLPMNAIDPLEDYKHRLDEEGVLKEDMGTWDIYYNLQEHFSQEGTSESNSEQSEYSRGGWGRYTISEIAEKEGVTVEVALQRLKAQGIEASADTTVRTIMDEYDLTAKDVIAIIKGEQ